LNDIMGAATANACFTTSSEACKTREKAADVAPEAFVRVYQNRAKFDAQQKFSTRLYAIAANLVKDHFRWPRVIRRFRSTPNASRPAIASGTSCPRRIRHPAPACNPMNVPKPCARRRRTAEDLRTPLILAEDENARRRRW
jgi:DNA-directed RNA polymerase specialized sigma24 family protein